MIFQHSQCFQCFQCSKKRGTPLKNPPLLRTQFAPNTAQGAHKFHKGETARQVRQHSAGGAHKLHKGDTARQGRQHSTGGAHKLHKGETARQGRQHSAGERTSSAGRQDTARATAQESRNEGGRLSEVATLAVVVLETYNHVVVECCKVCVDLLQFLSHFTCFKPCAYNRYND